jgi:hypothetical protein
MWCWCRATELSSGRSCLPRCQKSLPGPISPDHRPWWAQNVYQRLIRKRQLPTTMKTSEEETCARLRAQINSQPPRNDAACQGSRDTADRRPMGAYSRHGRRTCDVCCRHRVPAASSRSNARPGFDPRVLADSLAHGISKLSFDLSYAKQSGNVAGILGPIAGVYPRVMAQHKKTVESN